MTRIDFAQVQFPVGQGGFHMGWLKEHSQPVHVAPFLGNPLFTWAYDCGSDQLSVLEREIKSVQGAQIDMLFLSHLDDDHVVGVDKLLVAADEVKEVVLPYLGDDEWALHLASGASSGSLSGTFIDLVSNPTDWFGARGVKRITYVDGYDEDGDGPDGPDPIDPSGEDRKSLEREDKLLKSVWTRVVSRTSYTTHKSSSGVEVVRIPKGAVAPISNSYGQLNWVLSPFAFSPSAAKLNAFSLELIKQFGPSLAAKDYADKARTVAGRRKLRACYDAVWKTHNLHSIALYAGPGVPPGNKLRCTARQGNLLRRVVQPGWLSTGDFDFSIKKRRQKFITYYSDYASMVGQLMLSHHGSDHSFDASVLSAFSDLTFAIAAVGANGHGHPGRFVQNTVDAAFGPSFVRVDEAGSSFFELGGWVYG